MNLSDVATLVTIIGGIFAILAAIVAVFRFIFQRVQHQREVEKQKREHRREDLLMWNGQLQSAIIEYDRFLSNTTGLVLGEIIGKARAAILSVGDDELDKIADDVLTPHRVADDDGSEAFKNYGSWFNRNREGLKLAAKRMARLLKDAS